MKKHYLISLIFISTLSYGQSWDWGRQGYNSEGSKYLALPVATDKNGNAYITGSFLSTIIFGNDTFKGTNISGTTESAYLVKYNSSGNIIWAKSIIDSIGECNSTSITLDKSGNIYIAGSFSSNIQIGSYSLTCSTYDYDAFLVKYNSNGNVIWAEQSTVRNGAAYVNDVTTDKFGNVFITGDYHYTDVKFGSHRLSILPLVQANAFTVKYDSNGNVIWANQSETSSVEGYGCGNSVATDNSGNAFITGEFLAIDSFGTRQLVSSDTEISTFLVKYSSAGNIVWVKQSTNGYTGSNCSGTYVITHGTYIYITGSFADTVSFGSHSLFSNAPYSAFLTKYDSSGNTIWSEKSSPYWQGAGLASDTFSHIYMEGSTSGVAPVDSLTFKNYTLYSDPNKIMASYLMEFDTSGTPICGSILNNLYENNFSIGGIASDPTGNYVYAAGIFGDTLFCRPDTLLPHVGWSTFVGRWRPCGSTEGIQQILSKNTSILLYPNPNNGQFTIRSSEVSKQSSLEVYNMLGEKVYSETLPQSQINNAINLTGQPSGVYFYRVLSEADGLVGEGKVVIQK